MEKTMKKNKNWICPVWMAYTFDNPLRKLIHNSKKCSINMFRKE